MAAVTGMTPSLGVRDVDASVRFYAGLLGLEAVSSWAVEGVSEWALLSGGGAEFMVYRLPEVERPRFSGCLYFYPEDFRALWERVRDRAPVEWEPVERPYGMREFGLTDPDGYRLAFGEPLAPA